MCSNAPSGEFGVQINSKLVYNQRFQVHIDIGRYTIVYVYEHDNFCSTTKPAVVTCCSDLKIIITYVHCIFRFSFVFPISFTKRHVVV